MTDKFGRYWHSGGERKNPPLNWCLIILLAESLMASTKKGLSNYMRNAFAKSNQVIPIIVILLNQRPLIVAFQFLNTSYLLLAGF